MSAMKPAWGSTRESVTAWLSRYGQRTFNASGTVCAVVKYPKLAEGDAMAIVKAAGLVDDDAVEGAAIDADDAISNHRDNLDSDAGREELTDSRENRDDCIEEFISELREVLLPEAVAHEKAEIERLFPRTDDPLPGLQGAT